MCVLWGGTAGKFELNGNIIAGNILAVHSNNNTTGVVKITGDTTSSYVSSIWAYGNSSYDFILNGGRHIINGTVSNGVVAINGSAMTFLNNASFYNLVSDSDILSLNNASSSIILSNCLGVSEGSLGYAIKGVAVGSVYIHSSRFNKILDPTLTDLYTPSGLIVDTLTKVPKF
jgi:hypothetical protein